MKTENPYEPPQADLVKQKEPPRPPTNIVWKASIAILCLIGIIGFLFAIIVRLRS